VSARYLAVLGRSLPDLRLPVDPTGVECPWEAAAAAEDDEALLAWRALEQAVVGLPGVIDGARRGRLLDADDLATTWEAWRLRDGARLMLRCLHPQWRADAVMRRRLSLAVARCAAVAAAPVQLHLDGDWPHLRVLAPGAPLVDRLPVEDPPETATLGRLLGAGLVCLERLHAAGRVHGGPVGPLLVDGPGGARLHWLDPLAPGRSPDQDLQALGAAVAVLDPEGDDAVGHLARAWITDPPPSAADGLRLLRRTLAGELLASRHHLALSSRRVGRRDRATRLARAARALLRATTPPPGLGCLRADARDGTILVSSDGCRVHGGAGAALPDLSPVFSPERGLDAQAARTLLRAWATRRPADEAERQRIQAELGGCDTQAEALVRWLRAVASLRRARLVLEHQARPRPALASVAGPPSAETR